MTCAHCFRGDAQNIDINFSDIDAVLDQTEAIYELSFTGGEPLLNLRAIQYVLYGLYQRGIPLLSLTMVTNGTIYSDEFVDTLKRYKELIDTSREFIRDPIDYEENLRANERLSEDDIIKCLGVLDQVKKMTLHMRIGISFDQYHHSEAARENFQKYKDALDGIAYVEEKTTGNIPKKVGRAKTLRNGITFDENTAILKQQVVEYKTKYYDPCTPCSRKIELAHDNQVIILCEIGVSATGYITSMWVSGYMPYDEEDEIFICHASDDIFDNIHKYNANRLSCGEFKRLHRKIFYTDDEKPGGKMIFLFQN